MGWGGGFQHNQREKILKGFEIFKLIILSETHCLSQESLVKYGRPRYTHTYPLSLYVGW